MGCNWRVVGASVQGASHVKSGQPCQDAHHWMVTQDGILIAAIADGAGSAAFGEVGARTAVTAIIDFLQGRLSEAAVPADEGGWRELLTTALQSARANIERKAQDEGHQLRDLASTLIVIVAKEEELIAAQVGDGATVISDEAGNLNSFTRPQQGEYINETTFLVSADYLATAQFAHRRERFRHLAVFSDGFQMLALKMPAGEPHAPFFYPLFNFTANAGDDAQGQLAAFLRSPRISERTDDDLTLLLATRI